MEENCNTPFANSSHCQSESLGDVMSCLCLRLYERFPHYGTQTGTRMTIFFSWEDWVLPEQLAICLRTWPDTESKAIYSHCCCHCHMVPCILCFWYLSKPSMQKLQAILLVQWDVIRGYKRLWKDISAAAPKPWKAELGMRKRLVMLTSKTAEWRQLLHVEVDTQAKTSLMIEKNECTVMGHRHGLNSNSPKTYR